MITVSIVADVARPVLQKTTGWPLRTLPPAWSKARE